jgi:hypothetical protein
MKLDPTVAVAVKILGKNAQGDVERAIENLCYVNEFALRRSKNGKIAARRLARALRGVKLALNNEDLPFTLRRNLNQLSTWIDHCQTSADQPLYPAPESNFQWRSRALERCAAEAAYDLMQKYSKQITTTKGSDFEKLAQALAGVSNANFHHYCREVVHQRETGS